MANVTYEAVMIRGGQDGGGGLGSATGSGGGGGGGAVANQQGGGGGGGDAALKVTGRLQLTGGSGLTMTSGDNVADGADGKASLEAHTLSAQNIFLTKNGGGTLRFTVGNLEIGNGNTWINANGLGAGDATIGSLLLTGGGKFTLIGANVEVGQLCSDKYMYSSRLFTTQR